MKLVYLIMAIAIINIGFLFNRLSCFKTGTAFFGEPDVLSGPEGTHYSVTTCALYRMATEYLRYVRHVSHFEEKLQDKNASCQDMHMIIAAELAKLNYSSTSFRIARHQIVLSNIMADLIYDVTPYAHFDNEEFKRGAIFVTMVMRAAQSSLARHEWVQARMALGFVLHSVQDFYSHTNWIELGMREPNKDLATGRAIGSVADKDTPTCKSCSGSEEECVRNNLVVHGKLTSGYFAYIYPPEKPPGKCNHGYPCSFEKEDPYCEGITKDSLRSAHGHLHKQAISLAYEASIKLMNDIWKSADNDDFGKLFGISNSFSLVFVIDISDRLDDLVDMIRTVLSKLTDMEEDLSIKPSSYIAVPFNGSHWGPLRIVTKLTDLVDLIEELDEKDLENESQHYYDALNEALKACEIESLIFFLTDASAHEISSQGATLAWAQMKQAKIDVLFVKSSKSEAATINELMYITDATGGLFININTEKPDTTRNFIFHRLEEVIEYDCILFESISDRRQGIFMIDPTITSLRINVVSSSATFKVALTGPKDLTLRSSSSSKDEYLQTFIADKVDKSYVGEWTYECDEDCAIEVNVKSSFRCRAQMYAALSDRAYPLVPTPPLVDQSGVFVMNTCDDLDTGFNNSIEFISTNGKVLKTYVKSTYFTLSTEIPSKSFRIRSTIGLKDGTIAYRHERALVDTSQILMVINDQPLVAIATENLKVNFKIRNDATKSLYVQLDVDGVLKTSKWYSIDKNSTKDDSITVDASQYPLVDEKVRFIPLVFALQAFKNKNTVNSNEILFRHQQVVPFYVLNEEIKLEKPTHFVDESS